MKLISIVTPCYNEEDNLETLYSRVKEIFNEMKEYSYEHVFIDNSSTDKTVELLKRIAEEDKNVKIILNARNFGPIRSPFYALLQAKGDAVIALSCDLQDPPDLIKPFIKKWEEGYKLVLGVKKGSEEFFLIYWIRKLYYEIINRIADTELIKNFTGFGLFDRRIIDILKQINDPYPYFRGLICDIGFEKAKIEYMQPARKKGVTKTNFYSLYDTAMLGITSYSKIPLRIATLIGFSCSILSILIAFVFLIYKLLYMDKFVLGLAPLLIGVFFLFSVLLFFIGILGEYIGAIHTRILQRPLVIEKERINF